MSTGHLTEELLDLSAEGRLDPAQRETIYEHVRGCPSCEDLLRESVAFGQRAQARGPAGRAATSGAGRPRWFPLGAAAAAALLVLAVFLWPGDDRGAGAYWMPSNPGLSVSRSSRAMPPELAAAIQAYDGKDAAGAVRLLQDLDTEDAFEDVRRLYLAGALLNQGQAGDALAILPDPRSLPSFRRGHAQWIRYLALEAAGESEEARVLLDQLGRRVDAVGDSARARLGAR